MKDFIEQSSFLWLRVKSHDQQRRFLIGLKIQPCDMYVNDADWCFHVDLIGPIFVAIGQIRDLFFSLYGHEVM